MEYIVNHDFYTALIRIFAQIIILFSKNDHMPCSFRKVKLFRSSLIIFIQIGRKNVWSFLHFRSAPLFFYAGRMRKSNSNSHTTLGGVESCGRGWLDGWMDGWR